MVGWLNHDLIYSGESDLAVSTILSTIKDRWEFNTL
jgi:hypothetical protein